MVRTLLALCWSAVPFQIDTAAGDLKTETKACLLFQGNSKWKSEMKHARSFKKKKQLARWMN